MHAVLSPSAAHRWVNCPGSVKAEQQYPDVETDDSREGTAAHWVAEQSLSSYKTNTGIVMSSQLIGKTAPNGVIITDELADSAQVYVSDVLKVAQDGGYLQSMELEKLVMMPRVHDLNWGTSDCIIHAVDAAKLIVWDFKHGHDPVECYENWQLIDYTIGAIDQITGGDGIADQHLTVEMRVVQPRAFHPEGTCRSWTVIASDLRGYANQLHTAALESQSNDPPTKSGNWCKHCKASKGCATLQKDAAAITDRVQVLQLNDLTSESAAVEVTYLRRAKVLLSERLDALETEMLEQIRNGVTIPGYTIGYGRGSLKWDKPDSEVIALGDLIGVDFRKPEAPITPTQAKKLNVDGAVINSYSKQHSGAAKLTTDGDTIAARIFRNN